MSLGDDLDAPGGVDLDLDVHMERECEDEEDEEKEDENKEGVVNDDLGGGGG